MEEPGEKHRIESGGARRIHITGGPGSGKTYLAARLARASSTPLLHLDLNGLAIEKRLPRPLDMQRLLAERLAHSAAFAAGDAWISEGCNLDVATPLFERADIVVLIECSWRIAAYRIVARHIKGDLARRNPFPGWRALLRFWRWSGRYYANRNAWGTNEWGTPETHAFLLQALEPYASKLVVCRGTAELEDVVRRVRRPEGDETRA